MCWFDIFRWQATVRSNALESKVLRSNSYGDEIDKSKLRSRKFSSVNNTYMRFRKSIVLLGILLLFAGILSIWIAPAAQCHQVVGQMPQKTAFSGALPEFANYRLEFGWSRLWPLPDNLCLLAITPDGGALQMPRDFQTLVRREHLSISSTERAQDLAVSYVTVTSPFKVVVISNLGMIPGIDRNPAPRDFGVAISAPVVETSAQGYRVDLFAWKELGGYVERWMISISHGATIEPRVEELTSGVGKAVGLL